MNIVLNSHDFQISDFNKILILKINKFYVYTALSFENLPTAITSKIFLNENEQKNMFIYFHGEHI